MNLHKSGPPHQRPSFFVVSGKNSSKTCFLLQNTRRKKAKQGSPTISRVPPRGLISSCFLAKTHQTRVFCSKIREERRPIRAHLPFSLSPKEALFIRGCWLKCSKNVCFASKDAKKEGQSGLPYQFPCPRQEAIFIRGSWQKRIKNVFFAPQYAKKEGQSGLICHFPCLPKRPYLFVISG